MLPSHTETPEDPVAVINRDGASSVVLVCEHASHHIPASFDGLGLSQADRISHAVWDPGALEVAMRLSTQLDATLVAGLVSRIVYDCNRPPEAEDAMPARSELIEIPGNTSLTAKDRAARVDAFYRPFYATLRAVIEKKATPVIVTIHSFTPVYHGEVRAVELGVLHDSDTRLADAMLDRAGEHTNANVLRNLPYGPEDGVTHTLKEHAIRFGHLNVMLEIRSDVIASDEAQTQTSYMIAGWLRDALAQMPKNKAVQC